MIFATLPAHVAITHRVNLRAFVKQAVDAIRDQCYAQWRGGASGADDDAGTVM